MRSREYYTELIGSRFGLLIVTGYIKDKTINKIRATWKCDCGNEGNSLLTTIVNRSKSCGCLRPKNRITHGRTGDRLYHIWNNMKERCLNPNNERFYDYGGRGISICDEWMTHVNFFEWALINGYSKELTLDREEVNGNYNPDNCRWVTYIQQARNTRNNLMVILNGEEKCLAEWCDLKNFPYMKAYKRIKRGWDAKKLFI